ncbi:hypothetical protein GQ53DRAFT_137001 [Thozetella sp. PMI_491]|nr:hypothetical protein GQ53DRAFT_137001 [Thozetella sp. PMI_491]
MSSPNLRRPGTRGEASRRKKSVHLRSLRDAATLREAFALDFSFLFLSFPFSVPFLTHRGGSQGRPSARNRRGIGAGEQTVGGTEWYLGSICARPHGQPEQDWALHPELRCRDGRGATTHQTAAAPAPPLEIARVGSVLNASSEARRGPSSTGVVGGPRGAALPVTGPRKPRGLYGLALLSFFTLQPTFLASSLVRCGAVPSGGVRSVNRRPLLSESGTWA